MESKLFVKKLSKTPRRRWTAKEELAIIQYLKENITTFEQPTSQAYYEKFLQKSDLCISWSLIKNKVRHLRLKYIRARKLIKHTKPEDVNWENVRKICPFYKRMDEIFAGWDGTTKEIKLDLDMFSDSTSSFQNTPDDAYYTVEEDKEIKPLVVYEPTVDIDLPEAPDNEVTVETQFEEVLLLPTPTEDVPTVASEKEKIPSQPFEQNFLDHDQQNVSGAQSWEIEKFLKVHKLKYESLDLERQKFQFEKEKFQKEFQLRVREMQWKCEMGHAEIEMKERITMRELDIKEKVALKELQDLSNQYERREM